MVVCSQKFHNLGEVSWDYPDSNTGVQAEIDVLAAKGNVEQLVGGVDVASLLIDALELEEDPTEYGYGLGGGTTNP